MVYEDKIFTPIINEEELTDEQEGKLGTEDDDENDEDDEDDDEDEDKETE